MKKEELEGIARGLLIELPENATKSEIIAIFKEENVTKEDYENLEIPPEPSEDAPVAVTTEGIVTTADLQVDEPEKAVVQGRAAVAVAPAASNEPVLLKYERNNATFEILTYRFTREHPFSLVEAKDADYIVRNIPGFRPAVQSEAADFYS